MTTRIFSQIARFATNLDLPHRSIVQDLKTDGRQKSVLAFTVIVLLLVLMVETAASWRVSAGIQKRARKRMQINTRHPVHSRVRPAFLSLNPAICLTDLFSCPPPLLSFYSNLVPGPLDCHSATFVRLKIAGECRLREHLRRVYDRSPLEFLDANARYNAIFL